MTRKLDQKETDLAEKQQNMLTLKVSVAHEHKKLEIAKKMLAAAESKAENNSTQLADLKKSKKELEKKKAAYEAEIQDMMQRGELNLSDEQVREYGQLKDQAQRESAMVQRELLMAEQVFEGDKSSLNHELRRQKEHQERVKAKEGDVRRIETQIATLAQRIKETEEETKILKADLKKIENDVVIDKSAAAEYNKELVAVVRQLSEASGDSAEGERNQRRTEALEGLKKNFPESVYGRLVDLCQPSHKRFNIATTKILQKHMNSIVCDTEETAAKAIVYLKVCSFFTSKISIHNN